MALYTGILNIISCTRVCVNQENLLISVFSLLHAIHFGTKLTKMISNLQHRKKKLNLFVVLDIK